MSVATSTVTAAVYSQGFLRLLGTFSHHAWAELVLSSQLSLGHGKADDLHHDSRASRPVAATAEADSAAASAGGAATAAAAAPANHDPNLVGC